LDIAVRVGDRADADTVQHPAQFIGMRVFVGVTEECITHAVGEHRHDSL
jgi:hypothetical protein